MFIIDYVYRNPINRIKTTDFENWQILNPNGRKKRLVTIWEFIRFLKSETSGGCSRLAEFLYTNRDSKLAELLGERDYGWWPLEDTETEYVDDDGEIDISYDCAYTQYYEASDKALREILIPLLGEKFYMEFSPDEENDIPTEYRRRWNQFKKLRRLQMRRVRQVEETRGRYTRKYIRNSKKVKSFLKKGIIPPKSSKVFDRVLFEMDKKV